MAEEMRKIQSRGLRGYDASHSDGLWVEWSTPDGAWYAVITLYDYEGGGVVARYTFPLTNEDESFIINDYTFTEAASGHTYIVGLKYLPEADSEAWSESDESLTTITYTGPNNPPPPNPLLDVEFKIRDYDDDGVQIDYIGHNWTTFVCDTPAYNTSALRIYIKKSTDSEYTEIIGVNPTVSRDVSGTNGDFNWEAGIYGSGYFPGWLWLNFTNLEPLTTYVILAEGELSGECYPLINGTEIEWTTTDAPIQSKLPAPTGLAVTDITESSSVLHWGEVDNASGGYTVRWRRQGASDWNTDNV